jgi:hypothetical protein
VISEEEIAKRAIGSKHPIPVKDLLYMREQIDKAGTEYERTLLCGYEWALAQVDRIREAMGVWLDVIHSKSDVIKWLEEGKPVKR